MATEMEFVNYKQFVENLPARTSAKSGDKTVVSNSTDGPGSETNAAQAQKVLAGNIAQEFDPERDENNKYIAGKDVVVHGGKLYLFKNDHYGAWDASDVKEIDIQYLNWLDSSLKKTTAGSIGGALTPSTLYLANLEYIFGYVTKIRVNVGANTTVEFYKYDKEKNIRTYIGTGTAPNVDGVYEFSVGHLIFKGECVCVKCSGATAKLGLVANTTSNKGWNVSNNIATTSYYDIEVDYLSFPQTKDVEDLRWIENACTEVVVGEELAGSSLYNFSASIYSNIADKVCGYLKNVRVKVSASSVVTIYKWSASTKIRQIIATATATEDGYIDIPIPNVVFNDEYVAVNSSGKLAYKNVGVADSGVNIVNGNTNTYLFDIVSTVKTIPKSLSEPKLFSDEDDVVYFGDSFFALGILPAEIKNKIGGNIVDRGVSATTVCVTDSNDNGFCNRVDGTKTGTGGMAALPASCSAVIINGGTNDWTLAKGPLGTIAEGWSEKSHFISAVQYVLKCLIDKYPSVPIVWITPTHRDNQYPEFTFDASGALAIVDNDEGFTLPDVVEGIKKACALYSVPVVDAYCEAGIFPEDADQKTLYTTDGLHPSVAGSRKIASLVYSKMKEIMGK